MDSTAAAMAQAAGRSRVVGDYVVGKQIGAGSFSVVWHGRHKVHGTEVAIKEIATLRLNKKLQESLMSEIFILKRINHPNIISLHDIINQVRFQFLLFVFVVGCFCLVRTSIFHGSILRYFHKFLSFRPFIRLILGIVTLKVTCPWV